MVGIERRAPRGEKRFNGFVCLSVRLLSGKVCANCVSLVTVFSFLMWLVNK